MEVRSFGLPGLSRIAEPQLAFVTVHKTKPREHARDEILAARIFG